MGRAIRGFSGSLALYASIVFSSGSPSRGNSISTLSSLLTFSIAFFDCAALSVLIDRKFGTRRLNRCIILLQLSELHNTGTSPLTPIKDQYNLFLACVICEGYHFPVAVKQVEVRCFQANYKAIACWKLLRVERNKLDLQFYRFTD